jgi:tetratricopeptide (TPR) repeat protein
MYNYASLLKKEGDIATAKIYYLKAIEKDNDIAMESYLEISNKYEQYNSLNRLTSNIAINHIQLLLSDNDIQLFKRRIEKNRNNVCM